MTQAKAATSFTATNQMRRETGFMAANIGSTTSEKAEVEEAKSSQEVVLGRVRNRLKPHVAGAKP